jgi:hypothetical protein
LETDQVYSRIDGHVRDFFSGHEITEHVWPLGPTVRIIPRFDVLQVAPGPRINLWTYISMGAWEVERGESGRLEFVILAAEENARHVELLAMTAWYHSNHGLGLGHTLPIGEPWLEGASCDHLLVSHPYPFGEELEICDLNSTHVHFLWLLPITLAEKEFKVENGLEALEELFAQHALKYWVIERDSVV